MNVRPSRLAGSASVFFFLHATCLSFSPSSCVFVDRVRKRLRDSGFMAVLRSPIRSGQRARDISSNWSADFPLVRKGSQEGPLIDWGLLRHSAELPRYDKIRYGQLKARKNHYFERSKTVLSCSQTIFLQSITRADKTLSKLKTVHASIDGENEFGFEATFQEPEIISLSDFHFFRTPFSPLRKTGIRNLKSGSRTE